MEGDTSTSTLERVLSQAGNFTKEMSRDFYSDAMGFVHAIDWSERWLLGLLGFHLLVWTLCIATRRNNNAQIALLLTICAPQCTRLHTLTTLC